MNVARWWKRCPECAAVIAVTKRGKIRKHVNGAGETCRGSGGGSVTRLGASNWCYRHLNAEPEGSRT